MITTPSTIAFALVGRIGTTGAWTLIGSGPVMLSGAGELYLAQNDERGQFVDNGGSLTATLAFPPPPAAPGNLAMPGSNPPV